MKNNISIWEASPGNIWNYRQNHPELVIKDIESHCSNIANVQDIIDLVRQSMLCRGINKWLKVRRDLIAHKKQIKNIVIQLSGEVVYAKQRMTETYCYPGQISTGEKTPDDYYNYMLARVDYEKAKVSLKIYEQERHILKNMCMTDRWQIWKDKKLEEMNTITCSDKL